VLASGLQENKIKDAFYPAKERKKENKICQLLLFARASSMCCYAVARLF